MNYKETVAIQAGFVSGGAVVFGIKPVKRMKKYAHK